MTENRPGQRPDLSGYPAAPAPGASEWSPLDVGGPSPGGGAPADGAGPGRRTGLWVLLGMLGVGLVVALTAAYLAFSGTWDPEPDATPSEPVTQTTAPEPTDPEPTDPEPTDPEPTGSPSPSPSPSDAEPTDTPTDAAPQGDSDLPPVVPADSLPADEAEQLGTAIDLYAGPLRYNEGGFFGTTYYRCLFTLDLVNLGAQPLTYELGFAVPGVPDLTWASSSPGELAPDESRQLIIGWEETSPEALGVTEEQCSGAQVELTALAVTVG